MIHKFRMILCLLLIYCGCRHPAPQTQLEPADVEAQVFVGLASYYSPKYNGHMTAGGTKYDPTGFTAAHRTLPLGSRVAVTNLDNNRSVIVVINDRGPSRADRILDLSFAAAQELDMVTAGIVKVRLEVLNE